MRCAKCIDDPAAIFLTSNQRADTDDRGVDVFRKLVAHCSADVVVGLAGMPVGRGKSFDVGNGFDVPNDHTRAHDPYSNRWAPLSPPERGSARTAWQGSRSLG